MWDLQVLMDQARQHGLRMTRQRALILLALYELDGHASAEEVHEQVLRHRPDVDLSTVYRTLERLRDLRILSQADLGHGCAEYEIVAEQPHHHLICQGCGHMIDLDHTYLTTPARTISQDFDFEPIFDHLAIYGWCRECQKDENEFSAKKPFLL
jgi:Fur family ferric uptake transcriptional regulator